MNRVFFGQLSEHIMGIAATETKATVFWVDPRAGAEYAQVPERMRVCRSVDEASAFVLRELAPIFRPDARILTEDKILMFTDIVDTNTGPLAKIARQHFGPGSHEHRKFQLALSAVAMAK